RRPRGLRRRPLPHPLDALGGRGGGARSSLRSRRRPALGPTGSPDPFRSRLLALGARRDRPPARSATDSGSRAEHRSGPLERPAGGADPGTGHGAGRLGPLFPRRAAKSPRSRGLRCGAVLRSDYAGVERRRILTHGGEPLPSRLPACFTRAMTRRRVFVVAAEYSASPRDLPAARRRRDFFGGPHPALKPQETARLFFRFPNRGDDGRTKPEDWERAFGIREPVALPDLLASAAHRALTTLHELTGADWRRTCDSITDMLVTSMPGLDPNERVNIGLVPQALQIQLGLSTRTRAQFVVGTSD